jgi:hypothetical protein
VRALITTYDVDASPSSGEQRVRAGVLLAGVLPPPLLNGTKNTIVVRLLALAYNSNRQATLGAALDLFDYRSTSMTWAVQMSIDWLTVGP